MKKINLFSYVLIVAMMLSCQQDILEQEPAPDEEDPTGSAGPNLSLTKFVAIGSSFVAGTTSGALFNSGQAGSLPKIMAQQFAYAGGSATFNQPDINSVNGYNVQLSVPGVITLGKLVLFDPDGSTGPRTASPYPSGYPGAAAVTCPSAVAATPALPAPFNTADLPAAYTGDKLALNNFGVPYIFLGQALIADTGNPASPYYSPFWARFAPSPGVKSILTSAIEAQGSFYMVWLGIDDVLLWAAGGADDGGTIPLTDATAFDGQYDNMIAGLMANTTAKVVVGNIPNITSLPYFYTVLWNQIKLDATSVTNLAPLKAGYNGALANLLAATVIDEAEYNKRLIDYKTYDGTSASLNGVLIVDQDLTDLSPYFPTELDHMAQARQATASDLIPLAAGSILGTCNGGNASAVFGVSYPVADKYALTTAEITTIMTRTGAFNTTISDAQAANSTRIALADVNAELAAFVTAKVKIVNGITLVPSISPPYAAYSEDGLHPNGRGYAVVANTFIKAINTKFGSTIPEANVSKSKGTQLPVNP